MAQEMGKAMIKTLGDGPINSQVRSPMLMAEETDIGAWYLDDDD
jgi:hypothetical protein